MLRVVLADDERKVIFLLRELIDWDKMGYEIVGVAHDGLRALELVSEKQPHLLVTDIRMPGCSGIDLIRQAKERQPDLHCIIISGYREFEYAQNALKYGVEDYLLKPIKKEELCDLLIRLRDKLGEEEQLAASRIRNEENQQERLLTDLRKAPFPTADIIFEKYGLRVPVYQAAEADAAGMKAADAAVTGNGAAGAVQEAAGAGDGTAGTGRYYAMIVHPDIPDANGHPDSYRILLQHTLDIVRKNLCQIAEVPASAILPEGVTAIVTGPRYDAAEARHCMTRICKEIEKQRDLFWDIRVFIAVGSRRARVEELADSLREARWLCADRICEKGQAAEIRDAEAATMDEGHHYRMDAGFRKRLLENVELLDADRFGQTLEESFEALSAGGKLSGSVIKEWYDEMIRACFYGMALNASQEPVEAEKLHDSFWLCRSAREACAYLRQALCARIRALQEARDQKESRPITLAKQYVQEHYDQPLRLEDVSDHVGFNATYFSTFFKKETGQGFADYLAGIRIEHAKGLLVREDLSVIDVCEQVGYKDLKYFSRLFKKVTGVSPSDYRKLYR